MDALKKLGQVEKALAVDGGELAKINRQTLRPLTEEEVYAFRFVACDSAVDRDHEHFSKRALKQLAKLFVGRPVLRDHHWSADTQTARIYAAEVDETGEDARLVCRAYMLRSDATADTVAALEAGILREVSVGCAMDKAVCSVCGVDKSRAWCEHRPGTDYNGLVCTVELDEAVDAYECSLVAVPAQKGAGVVKAYGGEDNKPAPPDPKDDPEVKKALALLELEEQRF